MGEPKTLKDALGGFLKESGLGVKLRNKDVYAAWEKVVGPEIAEKTRVVKYSRGTMTVEVAASGLYAELEKFYLRDMLESMQKEMGSRKVRKIKLRLGEFEDCGDGKEEQRGREGG